MLPSFSGLKLTSLSSSPSSSRLPCRRQGENRSIRATAFETLDKTTEPSLVEKSINTIQFLAIDIVEKANSGHPGLPIGCALMGHILYNPKNPYWFNCDRFVLFAGHSCKLRYALLHLAGYDSVKTCTPETPADTTRNLSQANLNDLSKVLPSLIGGSADLASSNMTLLKSFRDFQKNTPEERNVTFGVREHRMGSICNGIALHSPGLIPYCATFLVFIDYMRAAIRIYALSNAGFIYVMTHDSIRVGENGPTHQPIEHLASFQAMPNILMLRPADGNETAGAYRVAVLNRKKPSILTLSLQKLPNLPGTSIEGVENGGYTISDNSSDNKLDVILMATGFELEIVAKADDELRKEGKTVRVVSFVSWELFDDQSDDYKESVLSAAVTVRVSLEAGSTFGWHKIIGSKGKAIGINKYGASAPAGKIYKEYSITVKAVVAAAKYVSS